MTAKGERARHSRDEHQGVSGRVGSGRLVARQLLRRLICHAGGARAMRIMKSCGASTNKTHANVWRVVARFAVVSSHSPGRVRAGGRNSNVWRTYAMRMRRRDRTPWHRYARLPGVTNRNSVAAAAPAVIMRHALHSAPGSCDGAETRA